MYVSKISHRLNNCSPHLYLQGFGNSIGISDLGEDPKHVYTLETGVPILLKGLLWPTKPRVDLLHRSPPTNGKEETRLIMILDHVIDPEEEF